MIKKIILWYVLRKCNGQYKCNGKVVRVFSEEWYNDYIKGINIIKARRLIPKQPINKELKKYSGGTQVLYANCPVCEQPVSIYNGHQNNKKFRRDEYAFCNHCGQALDWTEEGE